MTAQEVRKLTTCNDFAEINYEYICEWIKFNAKHGNTRCELPPLFTVYARSELERNGFKISESQIDGTTISWKEI